jgi:hypothetical protein
MAKKQLIAGAAGIAVVGILSFLGYRVFKQLNDMTFDDFMGENIDDQYYQRSACWQGQKGDEGCPKSRL